MLQCEVCLLPAGQAVGHAAQLLLAAARRGEGEGGGQEEEEQAGEGEEYHHSPESRGGLTWEATGRICVRLMVLSWVAGLVDS